MFPPSSPMMDRVRAESDLRDLERKAVWNEFALQSARRGWLTRLFSSLRHQPRATYLQADSEAVCCEPQSRHIVAAG